MFNTILMELKWIILEPVLESDTIISYKSHQFVDMVDINSCIILACVVVKSMTEEALFSKSNMEDEDEEDANISLTFKKCNTEEPLVEFDCELVYELGFEFGCECDIDFI